MKIKTDQLSKASLVIIVDAAREQKIVGETFIAQAYNITLRDQCNDIHRQMKAIDKKLEDKKLSRKAYATLVKKYNKLGRLGTKKLQQLEELESQEV
jgi:hypothetical protein